jgi:hypothetical protein
MKNRNGLVDCKLNYDLGSKRIVYGSIMRIEEEG